MKIGCWYCRKRLGRTYYEVVGIKGKYCRKHAMQLAKAAKTIVKVIHRD